MESQHTPDEGINTSPLLPKIRPEADSATAVLLLSTFVAVSGSYVFGSAVGFSSPAQPGILGDLGLTLAEYSLFGSILTVGAMVGAIVSGKVADLFGRKGAMGIAELFNVVGWLAIAFCENAWWLDIGRLSTGFGIGILSYVVPVYIAEITPKNLRGRFTAVNQLMISCGTSIMFIVGNVITWRLLALIGIIPCVIQLLGLFFIPESPRWMAMIGQLDGCEASLIRLRGENGNVFKEETEIRDHTRTLEQLKNSRIKDLFQRKYAHSLIVGVGLMVLQQFGGVNAIAYYASAIFSSAGFSYRVGTTAMAIVQVPMTAIGTLLMDTSGRRPLLLVSASGTCLGCFLIGLSFLLQDLNLWDFSPSLALGGVLIFKGSFSLGMGGIPWVIMSEIFPINEKGLAGSLVTVANWLCSWIVTYSFNFLANWSSAGDLLFSDWKEKTPFDLIRMIIFGEFIRHFFRLCNRVWSYYHLHREARSRNQGPDIRGNTSINDLVRGGRIVLLPCSSAAIVVMNFNYILYMHANFRGFYLNSQNKTLFKRSLLLSSVYMAKKWLKSFIHKKKK